MIAPGKTALPGRLATLDLLRLAAALAVLAFHFLFRGFREAGIAGSPFPDLAPLAIFGALGVNLFFLISGFVIAWSAEGRRAADFAIARFVRLYPGFVAAVFVTFLACLAVGHAALPVTFAQLAANLTMLAPAFGQKFMDGSYWSIVLEVIFYGWVFLAIASGLYSRARIELIAAWLVLIALNETMFASNALRVVFLTQYGGYFAFGMLAQHMAAHGKRAETLMLAIAAAALTFGPVIGARAYNLEHYGVAASPLALVTGNLAVFALFLAALALRKRLAPSSVIAAGAALTYPLYLVHQYVGYLLYDRLEPALGNGMALAAVLVSVSVLGWLIVILVERPLARPLKLRLHQLSAWLEHHASRLRTLPVFK